MVTVLLSLSFFLFTYVSCRPSTFPKNRVQSEILCCYKNEKKFYKLLCQMHWRNKKEHITKVAWHTHPNRKNEQAKRLQQNIEHLLVFNVISSVATNSFRRSLTKVLLIDKCNLTINKKIKFNLLDLFRSNFSFMWTSYTSA